MNRQTWKEYKKTHKDATVDDWLKAHTDKRPSKVKHHKRKLNKITKLYATKKRMNDKF